MPNVKKVSRGMNILMGLTMSFFLSLIGNLSSGHFSFVGFITSFVISFLISFFISSFLPIHKLGKDLVKKLNIEEGTTKARLVETLVSDLSITPFMTFAMIYMAYSRAISQGVQISFLPMFIRSLIISLFVGFILIYFLTPLYIRLLINFHKNNH